ncbi:MAG TPA: hypothetical protein VG890_14105 [Puia sp.]|nr:hypothetical protein [Puia sp.]
MKNYYLLLLVIVPVLRGYAQIDLRQELNVRLQADARNRPREKLFVHIDRTSYLAGETVWFKIYDVDAGNHRPLDVSKIVYLDLLRGNENPAVQIKIAMNRGMGYGSFVLPAFLVSGHYSLRAYTNWMKNFSSEDFFRQDIRIVNTFRAQVGSPAATRSAVHIAFYPEGGSLVAGLNSRIAFKAGKENGIGLVCSGYILNRAKDTLVRFSSSYRGMGAFELTPKENESYTAVIRTADTVLVSQLPTVSDRGYVLRLEKQTPEQIRVRVQSSSTISDSRIYLVVQNNRKIDLAEVAMPQNHEAEFMLDVDSMQSGVSTITLFDDSHRPLCERLYFKRPARQLAIDITPDANSYNTRSLVNLSLQTGGQPKNGQPSHLSLSVFRLDSLQQMPQENILSYLWLSSALPGPVEAPAYYFEDSDEAHRKAADLLMLVNGWRRFKWSGLNDDRKATFEFLPEVEGPVVHGKVVDKLTGHAGRHIGFYLSSPGNHFAFCSAASDGSGDIRFSLNPIFNSNVIVLQPVNPQDSNYRVDIVNPFYLNDTTQEPDPIFLSVQDEPTLRERNIALQVENSYRVQEKRKFDSTRVPDSLTFYGSPDRRYNLDEYVRYATMEEVFREYVEDVRVRKEGSTFRFYVMNALFNTYFEDNPLLLIDGQPVSDATRIVSLDPQKIKQIEVVSRRFFSGASIWDGIVSLRSYDGNLGATQLDPTAIVMNYEGLQAAREFYSPVYDSDSARLSPVPDFRNVLKWSPQITIGPDGKSKISFYTSDLKGRFAVMAQGLTELGLAGSGVTTFEVSEDR